jgi:hypothetical protein
VVTAGLVFGLPLAVRAELPAPPPPDTTTRLAFGTGAAARFVEGSTRAALPLELTLTSVPFLSASTGAVLAGDGLEHLYFEFGIYMVASVAGGAGYGFFDTPQGRKEGGTVHLYLGLPIPLHHDVAALFDGKWFPYLVPYYRPSWGPWSGTAHEIGFMVKISYGLVIGNTHFFGG